MRTLRALAVVCILLVGVSIGGYQLMNARTLQLFGTLVSRVDTAEKVVALTFDDGPQPGFTEEVLAVLDDVDVKATFYVTGSELEQYPALGQQIVARGHALGNHTFSHQRMIFVTPSFVRSEVERTDALIQQTGYADEITFRPPFGKKLVGLPAYFAQNNRTTIMWDVEPDSDAAVTASSALIADYAVQHTRPGSIILLHVMYPSRETSRDAVRDIVLRLKQDGYRFVTVPELLATQSGNAE